MIIFIILLFIVIEHLTFTIILDVDSNSEMAIFEVTSYKFLLISVSLLSLNDLY